MKIEVDTHVHTVISDHAFSTITEVAAAAARKGLGAIVVTEHGPRVPGAPPHFFFNVTPMPEKKSGVRLYFGCEANILHSTGELDLYAEQLRRLDFVIAALHTPVWAPSRAERHTRALVNVIKNPLVDCIAHPENPSYPVDMDVVVRAAARYKKILEVNNNSFLVRPGGEEAFRGMLRACADLGVRVAAASDAHIDDDVGRVDSALELMEAIGFPADLVVNATHESFEKYLAERRARIETYVAGNDIYFEGCLFEF